MSDVLATRSVEEVAAWYGRLADWTSANLAGKLGGVDPLSARLLRHYLQGDGKPFQFVPPSHLKESRYVRSELLYHRAVYLTEKKARLGEATMMGRKKLYQREEWVGLVARLQGHRGAVKWDGRSPVSLHYVANCEIPIETQLRGTDGDRDLLYALHGFDLRTEIRVVGRRPPGGQRIEVEFQSFTARALDTYDWSKVKGIKVPNPDHRSSSPNAVTPEAEYVQVYHTNAIRLHEKGKAKPFAVESTAWSVTDRTVAGPASIDPGKRL